VVVAFTVKLASPSMVATKNEHRRDHRDDDGDGYA
jgi:hypothetical protein